MISKHIIVSRSTTPKVGLRSQLLTYMYVGVEPTDRHKIKATEKVGCYEDKLGSAWAVLIKITDAGKVKSVWIPGTYDALL